MKKVRGWELHKGSPMRLTKEYRFAKFMEAVDFLNRVAALCEAEGHHANFQLLYNRVILEIYTHKIQGLHENDFILAAKIEELLPHPRPFH